ncbi:MAG: hypothetical protein GY711_09370 [bacterium]|nr:hypothetical protein [bacterium]
MADLSDTQIRANLRTILAEAGIDPNQTAFTCTSGIVRLLGELMSIQGSAAVRPAQIDDLETSIKKTRGVQRVHLNLKNWERVGTGQWAPVEKSKNELEEGEDFELPPIPSLE